MFTTGISPSTQTVLGSLSQTNLLDNYYLAGGTAIALHLGHRLSFDLDFFSSVPENPITIANQLKKIGKLEIFQNDPGTFNGSLNKVKLSFFIYPYKQLHNFEKFEQANVASLMDLACMKLEAIASRGSRRDFVDLYFILQNHPLPDILKAFSQKYANQNVSLTHVIKSLVYFEDADLEPELHMLKQYNWVELKKIFEAEIKNLDC